MTERKVNISLQMKIRRYLEYMHEDKIFGSHRGEDIVKSVSNSLREELNSNIYLGCFKKIPIFNYFTDEFLCDLAQACEEITIAPEEKLFNVFNQHLLNFIFFLSLV